MGWRRVARFLRVGKNRAGIRSGGGSSGRRNCRGRRDEANSAHRLTESLHYPLPRTSKLRLPLFLYLRLDSLRSSFPPRLIPFVVSFRGGRGEGAAATAAVHGGFRCSDTVNRPRNYSPRSLEVSDTIRQL